jgi:hypothetical protein
MANVNIITKKVILPTDIIVLTYKDAPKRMIATFSIFLDANLSAGCIHLGWKKQLIIVPMKRAMMEAPSSSPGMSFSKNIDSAATAKQMPTPRMNSPRFFEIVSIFFLLEHFVSYFLFILS